MLVISGFFEKGVIVPKEPITNIKEGQEVKITIDEETEQQRRIRLWEASKRLLEESKDEILPDDFPKRFKWHSSSNRKLAGINDNNTFFSVVNVLPHYDQ